jgi:NAD(P)-dependent dehydrogenase (short-subunit alcohol dehydrogenase family)
VELAQVTNLAAIVTGGASGIGAATVERFLRRGTNVIGVDFEAAPTDMPPSGTSGRLRWVRGDVGDPDTWDQVGELAKAELPVPPTILVCCAARVAVGDILSLDQDTWATVFRATFYGAVLGMQSCVPIMIQAGGGSIVTVGSVSGLYAEQGLTAYGAAKAALIHLTKSVAVDFARQGIRANCVCPGTTDTPLFRRHLETSDNPAAFLATRTARNPAGRILTASEVASAIDYLAFDEASGITGAVLVVDAGLTSCFEYRT